MKSKFYAAPFNVCDYCEGQHETKYCLLRIYTEEYPEVLKELDN